MSKKVLVTDFDGTITKHDFYRLAIDQLIPVDCPDYWSEYRAGQLTHFDALAAYFRTIRHSEQQVLSVVREMQVDPRLGSAVAALRDKGWHIVVTSAGCQWYIDYLLAEARIELEVYANPGTYSPTSGLKMMRPVASEFHSRDVGIDKAAVVEHWKQKAEIVAFAGDGYPDAEAAKGVSGEQRFARADLAEQLNAECLPFRPFAVWSDVADTLLSM